MKTLRIFLTICFTLTAASLVAQSRHYNSQTLGMGNGGTAFIDGYHANFLNPANLMINNTGRKPRRQLGLFGGLGVSAGGTLLNTAVYDDYLTTGLTISGTIRENMLDDWFGGDVNSTRDVSVALDVVPFGFSNRGKKTAFSLATRVRTIQDLTLNRGFAELAFYGLDSDQFSNGVPVNFSSNVLSYSEISVGFAMELPIPLTGLIESLPFINGISIYAGAAPKYLVGIQAFDAEFNSTLTVDAPGLNQAITHDFNYTLRTFGDLSDQLTAYSNARESDPDAKLDDYLDYSGSDLGTLGSGFGLDLGVTAELDVSIPALGLLGKRQVLRLSMAMTDLGSITYDSSPSEITASDVYVFDANVGDSTIGDYFDAVSDSLENDVYGGFSALAIGDNKYDLPGMYHFGAALTLGKLTTTLDYGVGFNDVGRNIEGSSLTLGLEYRLLNFIPLRFGTRYGGDDTAYSFGAGLDFRFFDFTFGAMTIDGESSSGTEIAFAWSGLVIRF